MNYIMKKITLNIDPKLALLIELFSDDNETDSITETIKASISTHIEAVKPYNTISTLNDIINDSEEMEIPIDETNNIKQIETARIDHIHLIDHCMSLIKYNYMVLSSYTYKPVGLGKTQCSIIMMLNEKNETIVHCGIENDQQIYSTRFESFKRLIDYLNMKIKKRYTP